MAIQAQHKDITFNVGDTVKINYKIIEDKKTRIQPYKGVVIGIKGSKDTKSFTVRRIAVHSIGMERIFPLNSPWIKSIEVVKKGKARRAKLNYLRDRKGKAALYIKERK